MDKTYYDGLIEGIEESNREYAAERQAKKEEKIEKVKNLKIRKKNIAKVFAGAGVAVALITGVVVYENRPINVVTNELMSDANLNRSDNDKPIDSHMTSDELLAYIEKHDLSLEEIEKAVSHRLSYAMIDQEFGMEKVQNANPEVFQEEGKSIGK